MAEQGRSAPEIRYVVLQPGVMDHVLHYKVVRGLLTHEIRPWYGAMKRG